MVGVLEILIGCFFTMAVPKMITSAIGTYASTPDFHVSIQAGIMFIWLGIGSIMARRWARALLLILGWFCLLTGIPMLCITAPGLSLEISEYPRTAGPIMSNIIVILFMINVMIVVQGLLVLFYRSRHVKAICEARNPAPCWTDACPLPVLASSLFSGILAVSILEMAIVYRGVMPFFGCLLSGAPGIMVIVAIIAMWCYCAWATYRLKVTGWQIALVGYGVMVASSVLTLARTNPVEMYRLMGYPQHQIEQVERCISFNIHILLFTSLFSLPFLGFMVYVEKFFPRKSRLRRSSGN